MTLWTTPSRTRASRRVNPREELAAIRLEAWSLLAELRAGELEVEVVEQATALLDTLLETVRVEQRHLKRAGEAPARTAPYSGLHCYWPIHLLGYASYREAQKYG